MNNEELCEMLNNIYLLPQLFKKSGFKYENFNGYKKSFNYHLILIILKEQEKLPMSEIGKLMGIKKQNMTYIVDRLVKNGLIRRVPDMKDRRVINITITDEGKEYLSEWQKNIIKEINGIFDYFNEEDLKKLHSSIKNIKCVLSKIGND